MPDDVQLLATGDLHLGRHPARIPAELDGRQFSPAAVWDATVDEALERDVDAVLVSGDVVDRENRYVEAFGDVERGARRLDDADVPLVVVAGNHDHDALPELVDALDCEGVRLLGADGTWERTAVERDGDPICLVDGWSFPSEHVFRNPMDDYDDVTLPQEHPGDADGLPTVGLLHADLGARDSRYAPVTASDLRATPADAWVLGHVHAPGVREREPPTCYVGSPQPLDPGEPGTHGPWLLSVDGGRQGSAAVEVEQLPLATLRYETVDVDVSDVAAATDATPAVRQRLRALLSDEATAAGDESVADDPGAADDDRGAAATDALELVVARVRLTGRTEVHGALLEEAATIASQLGLRTAGLDVRVDAVDVATRPAVDLKSRAGDGTPVGALADLLLALDGGDDSAADAAASETADGSTARQTASQTAIGDGARDAEREAVVGAALDRLRETYEAGAYRQLRHEGRIDEPDRADAVETLRREARRLLDELLRQREDGA